MKIERIAIPVALQRYVTEPPMATLQREFAITLARAHGAPIDVVTIEAPVNQLPSAEPLSTKLEAFAAPIAADGIPVKTYLLEGRPKDVLPAFLKSHQPSLIVAGTHSKQRPLDVLMGNTAAALLATVDESRVMFLRPTLADVERARELMIPNAPWAFVYV